MARLMTSVQDSKMGHRVSTGRRIATQTRARSVCGSVDAASDSPDAVFVMAPDVSVDGRADRQGHGRVVDGAAWSL